MADETSCDAGDWVEVERVLLEPADRSPNLPAETADKPLLVWAKGFALSAATVGDELTVETMTGRQVAGRLSEVNPGYFHTFGRPIPALWHVGADLRARVAGYRAAADGGER
jgi:2-amino-4-ketopentanoate thiolase alpha subunit